MAKIMMLMMACGTFFVSTGLAQQDGAPPRTTSVPAQPLLAQVNRLAQALNQAGDPLPPDMVEALRKLEVNQGDAQVTKVVQRLLDPLCLAVVEVKLDNTLKLTPVQKQPELVEQGWRTFLIKVLNPARNTQVLRV